MTPSERRLRAQAAAHVMWAKVADPAERTRPKREAFYAKFELAADPDGVLPPEERARRAEHLRRAHMLKLAAKSVQARQARKGGGDG